MKRKKKYLYDHYWARMAVKVLLVKYATLTLFVFFYRRYYWCFTHTCAVRVHNGLIMHLLSVSRSSFVVITG